MDKTKKQKMSCKRVKKNMKNGGKKNLNSAFHLPINYIGKASWNGPEHCQRRYHWSPQT